MHFISAANARRQAGVTESEMQELADQGVISGVNKNGQTFYSTREIYRIKAIRFLVKTKGLTVDQATREFDRLRERQPLETVSLHS